jgi:hypothetical protein
MMADAADWQADPGRDDQERSWDGADWADEAGPGEVPAFGSERPPEHMPQLHRAMSEAAEDLDAVEDRLSTLFERTEGPEPGSAPKPASTDRSMVHPEFAAGASSAGGVTGGAGDDDDEADDDIFDLFEDGEEDGAMEGDDDAGSAQPAGNATVADRMAIIGEYEDDIGGDFAALDAELAAEVPDELAGKGKRRKFGRRAKGTTAAQR